MSVQIPGIPQSLTGAVLVNHINDRLRRISQVLGDVTGGTGPAGAAGAPGSPGSGTGIYPAAFTIGVSGAAAKPDLSRSVVQRVVLAAATTLVVPANRPSGQVMVWWLYVDNPTAGALSLIASSTYAGPGEYLVAANTRTVLGCVTTQSGNTQVFSVLPNQRILTL